MNKPIVENPADMVPLASHGASPLTGSFVTPGDAAISHRALAVAALTVGRTTIEGLPDSEDVQAMAAALRLLGVRIDAASDAWQVHGLGVGGLMAPQVRLDTGNSSTALHLLLGMLAPYGFASRFAGSASLTRRPLQALLDALAPIGVTVEESVEGSLPLTRRGPALPLPFRHVMTAPSDQIKSALLLAAAQIAGTSTVIEPVATSDHTEKLLADFGAAISVSPDETGGSSIAITGLTELRPRHLVLPGDPSLAAYAVVAALVIPGSDIVVENVLVNPTRTGLIDTLLEMGGDIQFLNQREVSGEHVADLRVRSSRLKGLTIDAQHAATLLDDIAALAIAAAYAQGETSIDGLGELRHQQSDRLAAIAAGFAANKVTVTEGDVSLTIGGGDGKVEGGGRVDSRGDHSIAMSFLVLGFASRHRVTVDDTTSIAASFPGFVAAMTALGGRFETVKAKRA